MIYTYGMKSNALTIQLLQEIAVKRGGICVSAKYLGYTVDHEWECSQKHIWLATARQIKGAKTWCPICAGNYQLTIEEMQILAIEKGGRCLSDKYSNYDTLLTWECALEHTWQASGGSIKYSKSWCPHCAGNARKTIEDMQLFAKENNGKCLSLFYKGVHLDLEWECCSGHKWFATPTAMQLKEQFCTTCSNMKRWQDEINNIVSKYDGKCFTSDINSIKQKIDLECKLGHKWNTSFRSVREGSWCPDCVKCKKLSINDYHDLAKQKNGKCHINNIPQYREKIKWECDKGHTWFARVDVVKKSWCKICVDENGGTIVEKFCREIFEEIFKKPFPSGRYLWLKNDKTNRNLELDGYCAELNIAFEYQGIQHYEEVDAFGIDNLKLKDLQYRDELKVEKCKELKIKLIVIKPINNRSKDNIRKIIKNLLVENNIFTDVNLKSA